MSVLGPEHDAVKLDSDMDGVNSVFDRLDGGNLGGRYTCLDLNDNCSPMLSPLSAGPVDSVPSGHLSCFRKGFGEDKRVSAIYSPAKVMGDRDLLSMGPMHEDFNPGCSEIGSFHVSSCLDGGVKSGRKVNPESQMIEVFAAAMKPMATGSDVSLVAGSFDYGTVLSDIKSVPVGLFFERC